MGIDLPQLGPRSTLLQKALAAAIVLSSILVPIATAVIAARYADAGGRRDVSLHLVEVAVGILQQPARPDAVDIRSWAMDIIDAHSDVKIPPPVRLSLQTSTSLPVIVHSAPWEKGRLWLGGDFIVVPDSSAKTRPR
jgi:hypothetical protein